MRRAARLAVRRRLDRAVREGGSDPYGNCQIIREDIADWPDDPARHPIDGPAAFAAMMGGIDPGVQEADRGPGM